jgi:hypothetical protein
MSNSARLILIAFSALVLPACYSRGGHTYMTPMGPAGSPGAFSLTSPANGATATGTKPTFMWNGANGATTYTLQISASPGLTSPVVDQAGITNTMFTLASALADGTYYWQVIAHNATGNTFSTGAVATYSSFTTN